MMQTVISNDPGGGRAVGFLPKPRLTCGGSAIFDVLVALAVWAMALLPAPVHAQGVFPDSADQQVWEYVTWYFWGGMCEMKQIRTGTVTTVCDRAYIPVMECDEKGEMCRLTGYYRLQGDSVLIRTNYAYLNGVMDTVVCAEPEGLMYDFGVQPGDTLVCQMNNTFPPTFARFWAVSEEIQDFEGIDRRVVTMHYRPHPSAPEYIRVMRWISGIGSTVHPVYSFACIGDHCEQELKTARVRLNDEIIFSDTTLLFPCNGWVSPTRDPAAERTSWRIFPNPASTEFLITGDFPESSSGFDLLLRDPLGRALREWQRVMPGQSLDVAGLPAGWYTLQLRAGPISDTRALLLR